MTRRLRVAHIIVQPILVWDDGDNLAPGPSVQPQHLPFGEVSDWLTAVPGELERLAADASDTTAT